MNRPLFLFAVVLLAVLTGCDSTDSSFPSPASAAGDLAAWTPPAASSASKNDPVALNGHTVTFLGATSVDGGQRTRFAYSVTSVNPGPPALDWFFLENACGSAPAATEPSNAVGAAVVNGIPGIKWHASIPPGGTRTYAYTFEGALEVRMARAVISRGGTMGTATVPGPCGGHAVRGSVFVNADAFPARSSTELGIANVRVDVSDGSGVVSSTVTDPDGSYQFLLPSGTYTLRVPLAGDDAFNGILYGSYTPTDGTSPATRVLSVSADVSGQDVGFDPNKPAILQNLSRGGPYQTRAQDANFWRRAVRNASRGRDTKNPYRGGEPLTPGAIRSYLDAIFYVSGEPEGAYYLLRDPFVLTDPDPFAAAEEALSKPTRTDVEEVSRNLFAMQLNLMQGWGTPDARYDDVLMAYLEEWVRAGSGPAGGNRASATASDVGPGGGGGGTVEEQITRVYLGGGGGGTVEE